MPKLKLRKLFLHQSEVLEWASTRDRVALFLEQRLGKSLIAIRWAFKFRKCKLVLIVAPNDVIETWEQELELENITSTSVRGSKTPLPVSIAFNNPEVILCSYHTMRDNPFIQSCKWDAVILDESSTVRNIRAGWTKIALDSFKDVRCKALLSGTPAPESSMEYWTQLAFLHGEFLNCSSFWDFRIKYYEQGVRGYDWCEKDNTYRDIVNELEKSCYFLTRQQAGLGTKKIEQIRRLDLPAKIKAEYDKAETLFVIGKSETKYKPVVKSWLHKTCGGTFQEFEHKVKLDALMTLITGELKGEPAVIWFTFNDEIALVEKAMKKKGLKVGKILGEIKPRDRAKVNSDFQKGKLDYLLCQIKCAKFGRNFSRASICMFFSAPWDLLSYIQAKDRIIHPSKRDPSLFIHFNMRDSVDEDVYYALKAKGNSSSLFRGLVMQSMKKRLNKKGLR